MKAFFRWLADNGVIDVRTASALLHITAPITLVVGIILALNQDVELSWILVAIMPVLIAVILFLLFKAVPLFSIMQVKLDKLNLILDENLTGVRVVRAFNRIKHEEQRFDEASREVTGIAIKVNQLVSIMMPVMMLMINVSSVAIIWFGSRRVTGGHLEIGAMFAFLQYAVQILFSLLMVALLFIMLPRAEASAKRINEVLEMEPEIKDPEQVKETTKKRGYVEFQNVTFSYQAAEKPALTDISFRAAPGEVTAIIGGTGSGKSTLVNLIPRFYDVGFSLTERILVRCRRNSCAQRSVLCRRRPTCLPEPLTRIFAMVKKRRRRRRSGTQPTSRRPLNSFQKCLMVLIQ